MGWSKDLSLRSDEFYTRKEDIELMLPEWDLSDKIVYCFADGEDSEFVKYFKQPGKCKELIYTGDDFRTHEDLFEKCDIVVTNPPFSLAREVKQLIERYKKDYILITCILPPSVTIDCHDCKFFRLVSHFSNTSKSVSCQWISNLGTKEHPHVYTYKELYGKEIPLTEPGKTTYEFGKYITSAAPAAYKYGKKTGFPKGETGLFYVTVGNLRAEFEILIRGRLGGSLVKWRKL